MKDLEGFQIAYATIVLILAVFGICTNSVALLTIWKSPRLRTVFHRLIASLCISDFISASISPLFAYRRYWGSDEWELGETSCRVIWGLDFCTSYVTSMHITFFALIRLFSICRPQAFGHFKSWHAKVFISTAWVIAILTGFIPMAYWTGVTEYSDETAVVPPPANDDWCRNKPTEAHKWPSCTFKLDCLQDLRIYTTTAYIIFYYIPVLIMIVTTFLITRIIHKQRAARKNLMGFRSFPNKVEMKRRRKEYQMTAQLSLIVGSFVIGYIPGAVYHHFTLNGNVTREADWLFGMASYTCMRLSECLNPIFYYLSSGKMRMETLRIFSEKTYRKAIEEKRAKGLAHLSKPASKTNQTSSLTGPA